LKDQYFTLATTAEGYFMDKGSKFYAYAFPIHSEAEAQVIHEKIRKEHPKARHYCSAMRLHPEASLERINDDGEPSGSAGKPILGQLIKNHLTNVLVIVVRYFGGTKLGIPGLIEAYKTSTANAILSSVIIERTIYAKVRVVLSYESFPSFLNYCKNHTIHVLEETFEDHAALTLGFRKSTVQQDVMEALHQFSHMDFTTLKEYEEHLGFSVIFTDEEEIR
jgi:uncharacterized YigZ family protein